ncbi:LysR family transcriptional regulator [Agromyces badenianii]|uniref:LysR family transcriptional regulator n=1 Tax=Agromyces badenianii TaxID=2080742 RepID=UPI001059641A|nr:LysR family transcriptional regulator [Agromyces badenianii]
MEFRQLEIFRAIARELHFGRAAERLFLAQPTVSQQLRRLEEELGVLLVHRSSRSVSLTPAGTEFLAGTDRILASMDHAVRAARQVAAGQQGEVRVAANYPASRLLLVPLLESIRAILPGVTVMPRELGSPEQLQGLLRRELEVGLVYGPVETATVESVPLVDVPVVAIVRAGHPLAARTELDFATLANLPYFTRYVGGSTVIEDALVATAARLGSRIARRSSRTDLSGHLLELETTDAVGFSSLPRGEQGRANGMHLLRLTPIEPTLEIHAVWNADADEPLVNTVIGELVRLAESIPGAR